MEDSHDSAIQLAETVLALQLHYRANGLLIAEKDLSELQQLARSVLAESRLISAIEETGGGE